VTKLDGSNLAYKIGVRKEDSALLIYLNSAIAKVKQTPEYLDLLRKRNNLANPNLILIGRHLVIPQR
jgi:hypothetical protein